MKKPDLTLLVVATAMVFACSFANSQWKAMVGTENQVILTFASYGPYLLAGADGGSYDPTISTYFGGAFRSQDGGQTWIAIDSGLVSPTVYSVGIYSFATIGSSLFAGTNYGVFVSSDSGSTWRASSSGLPYRYVNSLLTVDSTLVAVANSGDIVFRKSGVFLSADKGLSWTPADSSPPIYVNLNSLAIMGSTLFLGSTHGIYLSTDSGKIWKYSPGSSNGSILDFAIGDSMIYAADYYGRIQYSKDTAANWSFARINSTLHSVYSVVVAGSNLVAGTFLRGIFLSSDDGVSWMQKNEGFGSDPLLSLSISSLFLFDNYLFAGAGLGVWRRPLSELTTSAPPISRDLPSGFALNQNYPNPFNPTTQISYDLPHNGHVVLDVYDFLGRYVGTLIDGNKSAGRYNVAFDATGLASGIYFYRLKLDGKSTIRKMLLLK